MITRRHLTRLAAGTPTLAIAAPALGQGVFPSRPIRMVVGFPGGQALDIGARVIAAKLSEQLGVAVVVDNRPGASGILAHEIVKGAPPDGYTLQMASSGTLAINPTLFRNLPYDPLRDHTAIALVNTSQMFLVSTNEVPVRSLPEMIAFARSRPEQVSYGSGGSGTTAHIAMEMLKQAARIDMLHVPYRGSPAMVTDLIAGRVQFAFDSSSSMLPHITAGRVRALASSGERRTDRTPNVPTVAESGFPGFLALTWGGIVGPAGMPGAIVDRLNAEVNRAMTQPDVIAHYATVASVLVGGTPAQFRSFMESEIRRWAGPIRASGAQVD